MIHEEKLKKVCHDFSLLNEDQQDYILGILQALVFAKNSNTHTESEDTESVSSPQNGGQDL
jgi:hypothetical protein